MKAIKGVSLFGITMLVVSACFEPPEFPLIPEIAFKSIYFRVAKTVGERDSLVFTISFKDGNGDLGLSSTQIEPPYHDINYYLANNGETTAVGKASVNPNLPQFVDVPTDVTGKLITVRTADDPAYAGKIPPYIDEDASCTYYTYTKVYVNEEDADIFSIPVTKDALGPTTHNLYTILTQQGFPKVYVLLDTFYYKRNPNYANIDVEFLVKESSTYTLYDWEKEFCTISFNQRFPVLTEKTGPLQSDLQYAMVTSGIKSIFGVKTLKLRIKIRDRSLNVSNVVETPEFTLDKITKGG